MWDMVDRVRRCYRSAKHVEDDGISGHDCRSLDCRWARFQRVSIRRKSSAVSDPLDHVLAELEARGVFCQQKVERQVD